MQQNYTGRTNRQTVRLVHRSFRVLRVGCAGGAIVVVCRSAFEAREVAGSAPFLVTRWIRDGRLFRENGGGWSVVDDVASKRCGRIRWRVGWLRRNELRGLGQHERAFRTRRVAASFVEECALQALCNEKPEIKHMSSRLFNSETFTFTLIQFKLTQPNTKRNMFMQIIIN